MAGWRLGGKNAPNWLKAPAVGDVKRRTREDLQLLALAFGFKQLPGHHPLRELWYRTGDQTTLAEARYDAHWLAEDLRTVATVPGLQQLIKITKNDPDGFEDFRYELRVAANVARSPNQRVLKLAGPTQGPDVEVETNTSHLCGIACYRGRTWTPILLTKSPETTRALVDRIRTIVAAIPVPERERLTMVLKFDRFPILDTVAHAAVEAFTEVWSQPTTVGTVTREGVTVARTNVETTGDGAERVVIFRLSVPERERYRIASTLHEKLQKEHAQWGKEYEGTPIMFAEESDFCSGLPDDAFETSLKDDEQKFLGILSTWQFFVDGIKAGSRIRVEQNHWHPGKPNVGLNLGLQTFGEIWARTVGTIWRWPRVRTTRTKNGRSVVTAKTFGSSARSNSRSNAR